MEQRYLEEISIPRCSSCIAVGEDWSGKDHGEGESSDVNDPAKLLTVPLSGA